MTPALTPIRMDTRPQRDREAQRIRRDRNAPWADNPRPSLWRWMMGRG